MLFHIALPEDYARALKTGFYDISTRGLPLAQARFIHCSASEDQVQRIWQAVYSDRQDALVLTIDELALADANLTVQHEPCDPLDPGSELFPHIYGGPIPLKALTVCREHQWKRQ
ncbi:DUF952 domain-containing protein [Rothia sp. P5766]|uniref:DUF952 domain-containing protein n=1 Tax=Rothia sp. P5766 TaxID=3402656 RepID=UPI003AE9363A